MIKKPHIVSVALPEKSYPIYIGEHLLEQAGKIFRRHGMGTSVVVITDQKVAPRYLPRLTQSLTSQHFIVHSILLPSGEGEKSLATADRIYTQLLRKNIERSSVIVALGGGVVGDLAGFIAATYQRGIAFVQIPTTLLAQVDSSVGGKVGINHPLAKNMIGAFYQPQFVLADTTVLSTLPKRELISGMGEVVKYGVILDRDLFAVMEKNLNHLFEKNPRILATIVRRCCELKAGVVAMDEKEEGLRGILNFGHTVGHALEHAGAYGVLKHGEAILYGMVAEAFIAFRRGLLSADHVMLLEQTIQRIPLPSLSPLRLNAASLLATMKKDKKTVNGTIRMSLPTEIGTVSLPMPVEEKLVREAIAYVQVYGS